MRDSRPARASRSFVINTSNSSAWAEILTGEDKRGLNPLFTSNMTPYGEVKVNMTSRLDLSDPTPPEPDLDALAA